MGSLLFVLFSVYANVGVTGKFSHVTIFLAVMIDACAVSFSYTDGKE